MDSVSTKINIKGGGVHQWYMMFDQQCLISVVNRISFKIKGWGSPFGRTLPMEEDMGKYFCTSVLSTFLITSVVHYT